MPQYVLFTLSVFWVSLLGIPKTLGIWLRGCSKHGGTQITVTTASLENLGQTSAEYPIYRQNLGWSAKSKIPNRLGFSRHMKTKLNLLRSSAIVCDHDSFATRVRRFAALSSQAEKNKKNLWDQGKDPLATSWFTDLLATKYTVG